MIIYLSKKLLMANTVNEYLDQVSSERKATLELLIETINSKLPKGFELTIQYGMISWVVPYSIYPAGYHCKPKLPLPFLSIAAQKNFIALYHMGMYAKKELYDWFLMEYSKVATGKPDLGKSCVRFKKPEHIPHELIGELVSRMSPQDWIDLYEENFKKK